MDEGEPPVAALSIALYGDGDALVSMVVSSEQGSFGFHQLSPGTYRVQPAALNGYFARPAEHVVEVTAGVTHQVPLPHYAYLRYYVPVMLKGATTP